MPRKKSKIWDRRRYPKKKKGFVKNKTRNFDDPAYKAWRKKVYKRDGYRCQWPGCKCRGRIQAHHILKWAEHPHLRFELSNGITLCRNHHDQIQGKEEEYVRMFSQILLANLRQLERHRKKKDG